MGLLGMIIISSVLRSFISALWIPKWTKQKIVKELRASYRAFVIWRLFRTLRFQLKYRFWKNLFLHEWTSEKLNTFFIKIRFTLSPQSPKIAHVKTSVHSLLRLIIRIQNFHNSYLHLRMHEFNHQIIKKIWQHNYWIKWNLNCNMSHRF